MGHTLDAILLLDKPIGVSSNRAVQKVRRALGASKAGHSGTLDPMASGLLPIGLGQGTKVLPYLLDAHKRYVATVKLGVRTTTGDAEGEILAQQKPPVLTESLLLSVIAQFVGRQQQTPPMYSALKHQGVPLYQLARQGITIQRDCRAVEFYQIALLAWQDDWFSIQVWCSKGSYIRTLAEDMGTYLGCGAHLTALRRIGVAGFDPISEGEDHRFTWCSWQSVEDSSLATYLLPIDVALMHLPAFTLDTGLLTRLSYGQKISAQDLALAISTDERQIYRVYNEQQQLVALVKPTAYQGVQLLRWMQSKG